MPARGDPFDRPDAGRDSVIEHDGFEHPAPSEDVMVVLGGDERLAGTVPEHEGVERGEQQARRRVIGGPGVGVAAAGRPRRAPGAPV